MVIATTIGNLAATGISYVSTMNSITAQRAELDRMWAKVHNLNSKLATTGRKFLPSLNKPIFKMVKHALQTAKNFFRKKRSQNFMKQKINTFKKRKIIPCEKNLVKRILKKQTSIITNSDR